MLSRTIHVTPLSAPTVTAPAASAPMAATCGHERREIAPAGGRSHPGYMHAWYQSKTVGWLNHSSGSDKYVFWLCRCIIGIYRYGGTRRRATGLPLGRPASVRRSTCRS